VKSKPLNSKQSEPISTKLRVSELLLDPQNPRLKDRQAQASQFELAREIALHYDALSLARRISANGFYLNQALLVYPNGQGQHIVAEGNRRFTAVLGLTEASYREHFQNKSEWERLAATKNARELTSVPVYIYDGPTTLRPIIAAEHLNGKLSWEPYQKAREIVSLVDIEGLSFEDINESSGVPQSELKRMYRDFKTAKHLIRVNFPESLLTSDFSKVGEITKIPTLLQFCGLPPEKEVKAGPLKLDESKSDQLLEIFEMVLGENSVTPDSRQIRDLGKIVTEQESLSHLRETRDLAYALEIFKLKKENNVESTAKLFAKAIDSLERIFSTVARDKSNPAIAPLVKRAKAISELINKL
jgi:hypothetical protein